MNNWRLHGSGIKYREVEPSLIDPKHRGVFAQRKMAVMMRLDGCPHNEITSKTGVGASETVRLCSRFNIKDEAGICLGETALIPGHRVKEYTRTKPLPDKRTEQKGGMAGAMGYFLKKYPVVKAVFIEKIFRLDIKVGKGTRYQKADLCRDFYKICENEGVTPEEWPLCNRRGANRTICSFIDAVLESNFDRAATAVGGSTSAIHAAIGRGVESLISNIEVLDVLEIDSHYLDGRFVLNIKGDRRLTTEDIIDRFWLICARCRKSKAIFAARYVFASEVTALDVFQVICDAFTGNWTPLTKFSFEDLSYAPGAGMPGYVFPEVKNHCIAAIFFDNAMQHYANDVKDLCLSRLGIAIDYGALMLPSRRTNIEGLFEVISNRVLHSLSSTTGRHPFDGRSEDPDAAAVYYNINVDEALETLDCYIANFNATPTSGANKSNSPLQAIAAYLDDKSLLKPVMPRLLAQLKGIGLITRKSRVQGNISKGIRPRIKLDRALYTSPEFSEMANLIGVTVIVKINPADYRRVTVYLDNGIEVGELQVEAAWREYKHSVETRKLINRAHDKKHFEIYAGQNPIAAYRHHLLTDRSTRNNLELKRLEQDLADSNISQILGDKQLPVEACPAHPPVAKPNSTTKANKLKWENLDAFKF